MASSKLVQTLSTLSKDEWSSLRRYMLMCHAGTSDSFELFTQLQKRKEKLGGDFDVATLNKKHFSKLMAKGFGNLMSRINKTLEDWLAIYQFESQVYNKELALVRAYNSRGLYQHADKIAVKLEKRINNKTTLDLEVANVKRQLLHSQYYSDNPVKYDLSRNLLQDLVQAHTSNYHQQSLQYIAEMINWGSIKNLDFEYELTNLTYSKKVLPGDEMTDILECMHSLVSNKSLASLNLLTDYVINGRITPGSEIHTIIVIYLISYSLKLWMVGELKETDVLVNLYGYGLSSGVLLSKGRIPQLRYYNILATLGAIKDFEWTESFINEWYMKVESKNHKSVQALSNALNSFYHQDYPKMLVLLNGVDFEYLEHKMRSLALIIIAMYKGNSPYDVIISQIENFKRTLKRNKKGYSAIFYKCHYNLMTVIDWLLNNKYGETTIDLNDFKNLIYRRWCESELKCSKVQ